VEFTDLITKTCAEQEENYESWLLQDNKLLNEYVLIQTFQSEELVQSNWTRFSFPEPRDYSSIYLLEEPVNKPLTIDEEGLSLSDSFIFPHLSLNLRSLACDMRLKLKLAKQSTFEMILRCEDRLSDFCPVVRISKDVNLRGFFLHLGTLNMVTNSFQVKKQFQLPESQVSSDDFQEFEVLVTDNGDENLFINLSDYSKTSLSKQFSAACSRFLPKITPARLCLTGSGSLCILKSIIIKYRPRTVKKVKKRGKDCVCAIF
jgi:hypothetical protein